MARKRKQSIDPRQRTLFDYFADNIEKLQKDKVQDNSSQEKKETFYVRQTNQSTGNRKKNSQARNDNRSTPNGFRQRSLLDFGQVGPAQKKYSPDELKALENKGLLALTFRLDQQNTIENRILTSDSAWEAKQQGMSDWEILAMHGVDTELRTTE